MTSPAQWKRVLLLGFFILTGFACPLLHAQPHFSISGTVRDSVSGEAIIRATVALYTSPGATKPQRGALTNKYGFFSIPKLSKQVYYLGVRSIGYKTALVTITEEMLTANKSLTIELAPSIATTKGVTVEADRYNSSSTSSISSVSVSSDFIKQMPAMFGETDVFRVLQLLPGVKSPSELSSGLYVRGGSPDQNLVLLDGVIVYNPSHLGGFLSTFNNDALRDVHMIKGGFPAEYGGRLSSVIDMTMKDGSQEKIQGLGGLSIISARATVEGPISKDLTFMVSGRRMYLDLIRAVALSSAQKAETPDYYFYDLNAKLSWKADENNHFYFGGFFGRDQLTSPSGSDIGLNIGWGNSTLSARWMRIFSPEVFSNVSLIYTDYSFKTDVQSNSATTNFFSNSLVQDVGLKADVTWFAAPNHTLKFGTETTSHRFGTDVSDSLTLNGYVVTNQSMASLDAAVYAQDEWRINEDCSTNLGLRGYYFQDGKYFALEPRLQVAYNIIGNVKLTSSFSVAHQFLHLIVRNDINLPTDLWFPSTATTAPEKSTQGELGFETTFGEHDSYLLQVEGYYKDMRNLYEYKDTAKFSLIGAPLESQFTSGRGEAYGMEVFVNKRVGDFTGWLGYTLSWTKLYFDELNNGNPFYARYDRRHDLSLTFSYKLSESIDFGASWVYGTGFAFTMPTSQYAFSMDGSTGRSYVQQYFTERNGYRLPSYHRLDLNFGFHTTVFGLKSTIQLSIYNAYNHLNPFAQYFTNQLDPNTGQTVLTMKQITLFPFFPSVAWNFNF